MSQREDPQDPQRIEAITATSVSAASLVLLSVEEHIAVVRLNNPKKRNALSRALIAELVSVLQSLSSDPGVHVIILSGAAGGPFSAGADINEIKTLTTAAAYGERYLENLCHVLRSVRKPVLAAVGMYAYGGGFELALMCDMIFADPSAKFGLPEIKIGTIPGAGGTQRLIRAVGKHKALHMILTGDSVGAEEAKALGIVIEIFHDDVLLGALAVARRIAAHSPLISIFAKEAVLKAENTGLEVGLEHERNLYYLTFDTEDKKEGMEAFVQKRVAVFQGK